MLVANSCAGGAFCRDLFGGVGPDGWNSENEVDNGSLHYCAVEASVERCHSMFVDFSKKIVNCVCGREAVREFEHIRADVDLDTEFEPFYLHCGKTCSSINRQQQRSEAVGKGKKRTNPFRTWFFLPCDGLE